MEDSLRVANACRFCGRSGVRFINAHIIPRSFFKLVRGNAKYSVELQAENAEISTPYHQAGIGDASILCSECEPKFAEWDTYGFEVLSVPILPRDVVRAPDGTPTAIPLQFLNYESLMLFFLSVLWRASVVDDAFLSPGESW